MTKNFYILKKKDTSCHCFAKGRILGLNLILFFSIKSRLINECIKLTYRLVLLAEFRVDCVADGAECVADGAECVAAGTEYVASSSIELLFSSTFTK